MKLAFFNFKFSTKTDYWLRELEERGNAQKRTFTILLYIYSVSITIEKSGRHWLMCEYCSHEAAAACIDDDIKKVVERLLQQTVWHLSIWTSHTQGQESVSGEWQETFSFSQYRQIQDDSGHCFVVIKYAPRVIEWGPQCWRRCQETVVQSGHDPWFVVLNLELENFDVLTSDATTSVTYWMPISTWCDLYCCSRGRYEIFFIMVVHKVSTV